LETLSRGSGFNYTQALKGLARSIPRKYVPAWVELEEEEEPVGFLDDDAGVAIFMDIFHRSVLPLVNAVMTRALTADSNSVSRSTPSDRIKTLGRERFLL